MQTFIAALGLALAVALVVLIRRDRLHISHGIAWTVTLLTSALLGFAPGLFDQLATTMGIGYPPMLAVVLAFAALTIKLLMMDIARSKLEIRVHRLAQVLAIVEADLQKLSGNPSIGE